MISSNGFSMKTVKISGIFGQAQVNVWTKVRSLIMVIHIAGTESPQVHTSTRSRQNNKKHSLPIRQLSSCSFVATFWWGFCVIRELCCIPLPLRVRTAFRHCCPVSQLWRGILTQVSMSSPPLLLMAEKKTR